MYRPSWSFPLCLAVIAASSIAFAPAYAAQQAPAQEVKHPDKRFVDQSIAARVVEMGRPLASGTVRFSRPLAVLGAEEGSEDDVISVVTAAAFTTTGKVALLDEQSSGVRVFDSHGKFLQRFGQAGKGPGDFNHPRVMIAGPNDELIVFDLERRLQFFAWRNGRYVFARQVRVEVEPRSMCMLGAMLVLNGVGESLESIIHVIDPLTGAKVRSFGKVYQSPSLSANISIASGKIACDETSGTIVFAPPSVLGEVRAWRVDGTPLWRISLTGLKSNDVVSVGGRTSVSVSRDGAHSVLSLQPLPVSGVAVQYNYRTFAQIIAKEPYGVTETLLVNPVTGDAAWTRERWPNILAVKGDVVAAGIEDTFPQVRLLRVQR